MPFVRLRNTLSTKFSGIATLVGVAALMWGLIVWHNMQNAPVKKRIEAGAQFLQRGQVVAAEQQWRAAVRVDPQNAPAWELLGDLYLKTRDYPAALDAFRHALENSKTSDLRARAAFSALRASDLASARRYANAELAQDAENVTALKVLSEVEKSENNPDLQLKHLQRLVEIQPQDATALQDLAGEYARRKDFEALLPVSKRLVEVAPDAATSHYLRGLALLNLNTDAKKLPDAEADFQKSLELDPTDVEAHRLLSRLYMRQNQPVKAIEHLEAIGRLRPHVSGHLLELSNAYRRAGKNREADQTRAIFVHLKQVNRQMINLGDRLGVSPDNAESCFQMAKLLLACVDGQEADFQLYRYRYLKGELMNVGFYSDKALRLRPQDAPTKRLVQEVEAAYTRLLQNAPRQLEKLDYQGANNSMARAILVRPREVRTLTALAPFLSAQQDPLGTLPPPSANSAFSD